jgi:hypothetical protein
LFLPLVAVRKDLDPRLRHCPWHPPRLGGCQSGPDKILNKPVHPVKNIPVSLFVWFVLAGAARTSWGKSEKAGLSSGLRGDKVLTPSPRRSEGPCDQLGALSEPHGEQNLYANPKRTAKFSINKSTYKPQTSSARKRFKLF